MRQCNYNFNIDVPVLMFEVVGVCSFVWYSCMCNSGLSPKGEFNAAFSR